MTSVFRALPGAPRRTGYRIKGALGAASAGLALVAVGAWLPWLTVFNGLTTIRGFELDGGYLAGMAVAALAVLAIAGRRGGSAFLRPLAIVGSAFVVGDSLYSGWRIASYVADPGPSAGLVMPVAGIGPLVMAAGGLALLLAAAVAPISRRPLERGMGLPLVLAGALFAAGWIHVVLAPGYLGGSALFGVGFLASGLLQIVLAALVVRRPGEGVLPLSLMVNVALIALYVYAVLVGLPLGGGHGSGHSAGLAVGAGEAVDPIGAAAELAAVALAVVLMRRSAKTAAPVPSPQTPSRSLDHPDRAPVRITRVDIGTSVVRRRSAAAALVVGPVAVGLGLVAHVASGGAAPPVTVAVALTVLVSLLAAAVARLPLPPWALGVGSGVLQQVLHLGFTALAGANAPLFPSAGHVHNQAVPPPGSAAAASAPEDLHLMVVAHVAAALATALLVAWALRAADRRKAAAPESEILSPGAGQRPLRVSRPRHLRVVAHHFVHIR